MSIQNYIVILTDCIPLLYHLTGCLIYSLIAWFVVLSASLEGPNYGKKSAQVYPEHPSTRGMGAEAND